jgi:HK97 gp10 family phage protein
MAFVATVDFEGFDEALRAMGQLRGPGLDTVIVRALDTGAKRIVAAAKAKCPVRSGALRESIRTHEPKIFVDAIATRVLAGSQVVKGAGPGGKSAIVGANHLGDPYYAHMVEYGHKVGKRPSRAKVLTRKTNRRGQKRWTATETPIEADTRDKEVPAQPFMRPAFEEQKEAVIAHIEQKVHDHLQTTWER